MAGVIGDIDPRPTSGEFYFKPKMNDDGNEPTKICFFLRESVEVTLMLSMVTMTWVAALISVRLGVSRKITPNRSRCFGTSQDLADHPFYYPLVTRPIHPVYQEMERRCRHWSLKTIEGSHITISWTHRWITLSLSWKILQPSISYLCNITVTRRAREGFLAFCKVGGIFKSKRSNNQYITVECTDTFEYV